MENKSQFILNLKSIFFDILQKGESLFRYEDLSNHLGKLTGADQVIIYLKDEWKQAYIAEPNIAVSGLPSSFSFEAINDSDHLFNVTNNIKICRLDNGQAVIILLVQEDKLLGYLVLYFKKDQPNALSASLLNDLGNICSDIISRINTLDHFLTEKDRYKLLFHMTEKFQNSGKMDALLQEMLITLKKVYPGFTFFLLLSHDYKTDLALPIKDLDYTEEKNGAMQAYATGRIQVESRLKNKHSTLYAPLMGRQGIYGVLQVNAAEAVIFPERELTFISLLARTTGGAIENVQLYQQSQQLISDLQLINETSHRLNSDLRLTETIKFMTEQIKDSFHAEEVGFILLSQEGEAFNVLNGSTSFFFTQEVTAYIELIKQKMIEEEEAIFIGDLLFPSKRGNTLFKSVMAVPMDQSGELHGFVLVMNCTPYHFTFESFKLLQSLIHHSTLAFKNSLLREELENLVITDHLTKLYSRNYLDDQVEISMNKDKEGVLLLIDIDNFKAINDEYGHQVGDDILRQVADIITNHIRSSDIGSRWGGEELAIYLPNVTADTGTLIARRLNTKVNSLTKPQVSISCGVSYWNDEIEDSYSALFKRADEGLYKAKNSGKNKVVFKKKTDV